MTRPIHPASLIVALLLLAACREQRETPPLAEPISQSASTKIDPAEQRRAARQDEVRRRMQSMPRFEQYPARDPFTGTPAPVDLSSAEGARQFRTALREGAAKGPNFAGHYTMVEWGCGTACQSFAVVDARTGRVTFGPRPLSVGTAYRFDSELLIADPPESWLAAYGADATDAVGSNARSIYYRWDGRRLIPLDSLPIGAAARW